MRLSDALAAARAARFDRQRDGSRAIARAERCIRFLGDRPAARVKAADLRRMVSAMGAQGLSPASCNRYLSALSAVLAQAGVELAVPWQREPRGRQRTLSKDEVNHLAQACLTRAHGEAVASLVRFLAETGLRLGEALALEWKDLDLDGPRPGVRVRFSKNGESRWTPLAPDAVQAARTRLTPQSRGPWYGLSPSTVAHVFRFARNAVSSTRGDREVVVHCLRHSCASRLVEAGVPLPTVQAFLGHRDFRSTLRYVHTSTDGLQEALEIVERYVSRRERTEPRQQSALETAQLGLCLICQAAPAVVVDHCHRTKRIRGILCHRCNLGIGHFNDDPGVLRAAAKYLENA